MKQPQNFGNKLGVVQINGSELEVFSNGVTDYLSGRDSLDANGRYLGKKYQCVELVRRYLYQKTGVNYAEIWRGDAHQWFQGAERMPMMHISRKDTKPGDIACFKGGHWGHVAIVTANTEAEIEVVQQNFFNDERDVAFCFNPQEGVSDGENEYTLQGFIRPISVMKEELGDIRGEIDIIDEQLLELLARRFAFSKKVAEYKKTGNLPVFDSRREGELYEKLRKRAISLSFSPDIAQRIFREILHESRRTQEQYITDNY